MVMKAITANHARFDAAIADRDPTGVAVLYTEDARLLAPGATAMRGRQEIENYWKGAIEGLGIRAFKLETVEVEERDDLAYEVGTFSQQLQPEGQASSTSTGKYVTIHRRQPDGSWLWGVDTFNFDS